MAELHVFTNEYEWVVAESIEDCEAAMNESVGATYDADDEIEWRQLDDDSTIKIWMNEGDIAEHGEGEIVEKTCREWAEENGRGFLCSTEH